MPSSSSSDAHKSRSLGSLLSPPTSAAAAERAHFGLAGLVLQVSNLSRAEETSRLVGWFGWNWMLPPPVQVFSSDASSLSLSSPLSSPLNVGNRNENE